MELLPLELARPDLENGGSCKRFDRHIEEEIKRQLDKAQERVTRKGFAWHDAVNQEAFQKPFTDGGGGGCAWAAG